MEKYFLISLFTLVAFLVSFLDGVSQSFWNAPDLAGDYCKTRNGHHCCDGRIDECSVPIFGTLCYCDQFCNRTVNPDCCPDYWNTCLGFISPPPITLKDCVINGKTIPNLGSELNNCNLCTCSYGELNCEHDPCLIDTKFLELMEDNPRRTTWSVANYSLFWGRKLNEGLTKLTGTLLPGKYARGMYPLTLVYDAEDLPRRFDARRKWPRLIGDPKDQGWCGSSWAFSTLSVAEDRLAIESEGREIVSLSVQNLISCNRRGQQACQGGHVERAWNYLRKKGVTTETCYPYVSGDNGASGTCQMPRDANLFTIDCPVREFPVGRKRLYNTEPSYRIASKEEDIMWEIYTNGPVQALMRVYQDFVMYRRGVYSRMRLGFNEKFLLHSVRLIGWGELFSANGEYVKYWLAANSWGENWGEKGLFKIRRGINETDIEHFIFTARARITRLRRTDFSRNNFI